MAKTADKIKASTQNHLDIDDITDDLIILKSGWIAMVMSTTAVNFDILSEAEQDATIYAYGAFLNSLTFPLQTLIRSKRADITAYYQHLVDAERDQPNPDLKIQMKKYREFIQSTVQQKTILDKRFYFILHFSSLEMGAKSFKKTNVANAKSKVSLIADAKVVLAPKRDHIVKQTARLGLFSKQLTTQELIELLYDIYNPAPTGTQRVILDAESYTAPLVEPAIETPTPEPEKVVGAQPVVSPINAVEVAPTLEPVPTMINTQVLEQTPIQNEPLVAPQPIVLPKSVSPLLVPSDDKTQSAVNALPDIAAGDLASPPQSDSGSTSQVLTQGQSGQDAALKSLQDAVRRATEMSSVQSAGSGTK